MSRVVLQQRRPAVFAKLSLWNVTFKDREDGTYEAQLEWAPQITRVFYHELLPNKVTREEVIAACIKEAKEAVAKQHDTISHVEFTPEHVHFQVLDDGTYRASIIWAPPHIRIRVDRTMTRGKNREEIAAYCSAMMKRYIEEGRGGVYRFTR